MKKIIGFFLAAALLSLTACNTSEIEGVVDPETGVTTIPFSLKVSAAPATKVTASEGAENKYNYAFSTEDKIVVTGEGITGELTYESDGKFSGTLSYDEGHAPESGVTALTVQLINAGKDAAVTDFSTAISADVPTAVQNYSNFTGSFTYNTTAPTVKLNQNTAFIDFTITLSGTSDGEYEARIIDDNHSSSSPIVRGDVTLTNGTANFVAAIEPITLENAKLLFTGKTIPIGESSSSILRNKRYKVIRDLGGDYFTIRATADGTTSVTFNYTGDGIQYKKNGEGDWQSYDEVSMITLNKDEFVFYRGKKTAYNNNSDNTPLFTVDNPCDIYGNLMTLMCDDSYNPRTSITADNAFKYIFSKVTNINIPEDERLLISVESLTNSCFNGMFKGCTGLTKGPNLNIRISQSTQGNCLQDMFSGCTSLVSVTGDILATEVGNSCLRGMFYNCSALTEAPRLVLETSAGQYCCREMFSGCTALSSVNITLSAQTLSEQSYWKMFYGCSSLVAGPDLPATTLAQSCYEQMFSGCSALGTAPNIAATSMNGKANCLQMFYGCTSLTTGPILRATTLTEKCYQEMFRGCTHLSELTCLATTNIDSNNSTTNWLNSVSASGTLYIDSSVSETWGNAGNTSKLPTGWSKETYVSQ